MEKTSPAIRIAVVCNYRLICDLIRFALSDEKHIDIISQTDHIGLAPSIAKDEKPDVLMLETITKKTEVLNILREIRISNGNVKVLLLALDFEEEEIHSFIRAGAKGCIAAKTADKEDIGNAIRVISDGELWAERKMTARMLEQEIDKNLKNNCNINSEKKELLTPRELEIVRLVSQGFTNKEIGTTMFISDRTVKSHLNHIFKKLHVRRRVEIIRHSIRYGITENN